MIEYKHDENSGASLRIEGNVQTITAEVSMLISMVYGSIHEDSPMSALVFRMALMNTLNAKEMEPIIWSETISSAGMEIKVDGDALKILADIMAKYDDENE